MHSREVRGCTRPSGGRIVQCARAVRLHSFVRCSTAAPNNVCKVWSSSSDLLFVLVLLPVARPSTSRRVVVSVRVIFMHLCGCATPHHTRRGTASQVTMCRQAQARAAEQCHLYAIECVRSYVQSVSL